MSGSGRRGPLLSLVGGALITAWLLGTGRVAPGALAAGLGLSMAIGLAAYAAGSLTASGVLGAVLVGTAVFAGGGLAWALLLIAFFVSSSALSRLGRGAARKREAQRAFAKGERRDLGQALANGGVAALLAAGAAAAPAGWQGALFAAFAGSLAAAAADTWATEIGVLSRTAPRLITTGRPVVPGTSGAVSGLGLLGAATGALSIGVAAFAFGALWPGRGAGAAGAVVVVAGLAGGLAGALADSWLGATVQQVYWCPACGRETERPIHLCGTPTRPRHGLPWVDNEVVNAACALTGALVGALVAGLIPG